MTQRRPACPVRARSVESVPLLVVTHGQLAREVAGQRVSRSDADHGWDFPSWWSGPVAGRVPERAENRRHWPAPRRQRNRYWPASQQL